MPKILKYAHNRLTATASLTTAANLHAATCMGATPLPCLQIAITASIAMKMAALVELKMANKSLKAIHIAQRSLQ
jgi:hypothetical protein